ncbi:sn-glycerol-3-phosphate ABC transporter ATP-binding protein UgpC [Devosia rhodophyticola]|uniref:Sn-glycerol-3-phosphate ABC transporter ATP-binding protein UgpC n=1 Tax=Devosia rhodophyticola TaxID=3026423 RepID=A0ABY7YUI8_9HYPH|nr:sn-glycerol-3-phosphate ABC transporter ATP-binding protein UgpC [Devosia rhodophyticola]WDR04768.1 sn-glycerol-3-phosphate ABC transporter ATP-binding protein UgpC [Devosia rhodophyticola]
MASLDLIDVVKFYGELEVLHGVDLHVDDGEFVVLVGPSGCGKSTLLRMIAGLETISFGDVRIGDTIVNDLQPKARDIAMVFQNYALYPHMKVRDNMAFSLKLSRRSRTEIDAMVDHAAGILDLGHLLDRYPRELSGGQRQRVAMGRAIVRDPAVFLFDEPLSNLDAKLRVQMRAEIKALHQRLKATTVYVTHDQIEAMTMADRIVVMRDGYVEQVGTPLDLYDQPANVFVAGFIGSPSMNLIGGVVTDKGVRTEGGTIWPMPAQTSGVTEGQQVVIGLRPEHFMLADDGFVATINLVEPTGSETHVALDIFGETLTAALRERIVLTPGATVNLAPRLDCLHLFDKASGKRLSL